MWGNESPATWLRNDSQRGAAPRVSVSTPYPLTRLSPQWPLLGGLEEGFDFALGGDTGGADAAQAEGRDGIREAAGGDGGGAAIGRAGKERRGEGIAGAGQVHRRHLVAGEVRRLTTV